MEKSKLKKYALAAYWLFAMLFWETLAHAAMYDAFQGSFGLALGFSAGIALGIAALLGLLPKKAAFPASLVVTLLLTFLYGSEMVYCFIFGTPYSVGQIGLGADAVGSFWHEMLACMGENILWLLALMVPTVVLIVLQRVHGFRRGKPILQGLLLVGCAAVLVVTWLAVRIGGTEMYSNYYFFTDPTSPTVQTMERFGVPTTFYLELTCTQTDEEEDFLLAPPVFDIPVIPTVPGTAAEAAAEPETTETAAETEAPTQAEVPVETATSAPKAAPEVVETVQPETTVPETTAAETTIPETAEPETTEPETTEPETTVPETTEPETTVPETTVPETTVPKAAEAEPVTEPETTEVTEPETEAPTEPAPPAYNILDMDFAALSASATDKHVQALSDFCAQMPGTQQNEYTGMLSDYNLILICAESFSPAAINPEVTPTLYKLSQEGFLFKNYYNAFPNTTTDGEYALCQSLFPDASRDKYNSSMLASRKNFVPFALGNMFADQKGVHSWGYHNYEGDYYHRDQTHTNMGYEMQFNHDGMELTGKWPTSDLEMMEQSVDDYIGQEQFNVYYMTFSGHYRYNVNDNAIAAKNYSLVADLPGLSGTQKCYLSCHIELDKALEYLMNRLEEAGVAEKTAIVIASDHFPYGLQKADYFGMLGQPEDYFDMYKSDLIFWVGGMKEPVEVEPYCCNVDVLPTILNLWGFRYDSRLLAGTDVFSNGNHVAILVNHSFLTDKVWFNSNTRETRWLVDQSEVPEGYLDAMNRLVVSKFDFSKEILRTNFYQYIPGVS